jgi:hypothetical protein
VCGQSTKLMTNGTEGQSAGCTNTPHKEIACNGSRRQNREAYASGTTYLQQSRDNSSAFSSKILQKSSRVARSPAAGRRCWLRSKRVHADLLVFTCHRGGARTAQRGRGLGPATTVSRGVLTPRRNTGFVHPEKKCEVFWSLICGYAALLVATASFAADRRVPLRGWPCSVPICWLRVRPCHSVGVIQFLFFSCSVSGEDLGT